jgi:hypothetical protein
LLVDLHPMCKVAGKRFVTNARWCCFFVSIWVLMHVDTKTMHRVTDKIRAELAPWVRDPPKLVSLSQAARSSFDSNWHWQMLIVYYCCSTLKMRPVRTRKVMPCKSVLMYSGLIYCGLEILFIALDYWLFNMLVHRWALSEERRQASSGRIARLHGSAPYQKCGLEVRFQDHCHRTSSLIHLSAW